MTAQRRGGSHRKTAIKNNEVAISSENNPYDTGGPWLRVSAAEGGECGVDLLNKMLLASSGLVSCFSAPGLHKEKNNNRGADGYTVDFVKHYTQFSLFCTKTVDI